MVVIMYAGATAEAAESRAASGENGGRMEVVLAQEHRKDLDAIRVEFANAGFSNLHVQFMRQGEPPANIGIGRQVTAEHAREALRLALKYNRSVRILLPAYLFPPRFITIASSNFDDTVEFPIDDASLQKLQDPGLTTDQFHHLYRQLTTPAKGLKNR
jgi:hypothetical protein